VAPVDDPAKLAAAKAKADELEAKLHAGGDFAQLARTFSDGPTASEGGDLGQFQRDKLAKVLEDKTFALKSGQFTEPIRTRQGFVILKVLQHTPGGAPAFKDVEPQVEEALFMSRMEPALRVYLTTMREQAFIDIKPGYADTGASAKETKPIFSSYTPPAPKKKKKVERTRFRENAHSFRQKAPQVVSVSATVSAPPPAAKSSKKAKGEDISMKPGKKEKIRYGQAPTQTLPGARHQTAVEDAGAAPTPATSDEPVNPLENNARPTVKTRYSARAALPKSAKQAKFPGAKVDTMAPEAPDAAEVADQQTQAGPLGLAGDTAAKKRKKTATTTSEKKRLADKKKSETPAPATGDVPLGNATPAPTTPTPQQ
jgi:peptidyl-prolyl cis-trans isomerase SurA